MKFGLLKCLPNNSITYLFQLIQILNNLSFYLQCTESNYVKLAKFVYHSLVNLTANVDERKFSSHPKQENNLMTMNV